MKTKTAFEMRFASLVTVTAIATAAGHALAAPITLDFEDVPHTVLPNIEYFLPFGQSYIGKGFLIEDLNRYGNPAKQGVLFGYFTPNAYVPTYNGPAPFKSADSDGQSLMPQYSTAAIQLRAIDNSAFTLTSLKLAGFFDRSGEFTDCELGPATCSLRLSIDFSNATTATFDLALDNYEGFEKWAFNLDDVVALTLRQTTQNLAQGIGGWSYQFEDIVLNGAFDSQTYVSFAGAPSSSTIPEPPTLVLLINAFALGLLAKRGQRGLSRRPNETLRAQADSAPP